MVKTSFHNRHIHAISHNCNFLFNSEIFVLIFNFSPQLGYLICFTLSWKQPSIYICQSPKGQ